MSEIDIDHVEIAFSDGTHLRVLPGSQEVFMWQDARGAMLNFEKVSLGEVVRFFKEQQRLRKQADAIKAHQPAAPDAPTGGEG